MLHYYLGRQPIYDIRLNVKAYELLYRSAESSGSADSDGDAATSNVLLNTFMERGFSKVVGEHQAFVNLTRNFIIEKGMLPPPNGQLVLEILEGLDVDQCLIDGVRRLKKQGYPIALDDFVFKEEWRPLIELADIVKIDLRALEREQVIEHIMLLRQYPVKLLAEKVETLEEFEWCKSIGFDYFQGYFLCKPRVLTGRRMPTNRMSTLRVLSKLREPDVDIPALERIVGEDVTMSYKLLRYINSPVFCLDRKVESIRHAIVFLGLREVKHWASMIAVASLDDKPSELMMTSLVRARMCELLSEKLRKGNHGTAFIIGLFSLLDALMDRPLEELLESLSLSDEIKNALLNNSGTYAGFLKNVLAYEHGNWDAIECPDLEETMIADIYMQSIEWARQTMSTL